MAQAKRRRLVMSTSRLSKDIRLRIYLIQTKVSVTQNVQLTYE